MHTKKYTRRSALRIIGLASLACLANPLDAFAGSSPMHSPAAGGHTDGKGDIERRLIGQGLIDVQTTDPLLLVDLKYARSDNFMGENVYGDLRKCYLHPEPALMLKEAHARLHDRNPDLVLLLLDGVRPRSVQQRMWEMVKNTPMQPYVANPARGSMHNYGAAVDVTIARADGTPLDMGTRVDHFGMLAQPREEQRFLREGMLSPEQVANREILRNAMLEAGFQPLAIEWWHFNAFDKDTTRRRYAIIE
ncbi:M15 family metallopeptidase [Desulfocurvibacter africanus]|uniref:M15 family metallopeptidase n=1 Tax=Desulfocurvibacter africanus TaxID=873 RepID=UPI00048334B9|nr:M15 family metallopeptidase [Desulfocurvibacter africanus]